jgi:hypothetical protein
MMKQLLFSPLCIDYMYLGTPDYAEAIWQLVLCETVSICELTKQKINRKFTFTNF